MTGLRLLTAMLLVQIRRFLTAPIDHKSSRWVRFWFILSLTFALICGILALKQAFGGEYVVQDDARQHVFWMRRFLDPSLFPQDLIADYFQSVAPPLYVAVYRLMAGLGIDPIVFNKFLPVGLGLVATAYCFGVCLQLLPVPAAAFVATLLLNQALWLKDDLGSGTARAFAIPLFLAFLYYLLRRALFPLLVMIVLQGLIYPLPILIYAGLLVLRLGRWDQGRLGFSVDRRDYVFCAAGLGVALMMLLPVVLEASEYGPTISGAIARTSPAFAEGGDRFFLPMIRLCSGSHRSAAVCFPVNGLGYPIPISRSCWLLDSCC